MSVTGQSGRAAIFGDGNGRADGAAGRQPLDEIARQDRDVCRHGGDGGDAGCVLRVPVKGGLKTGNRTEAIGIAIRHDGETEVCEALRISVGIDDETRDLRLEAGDDVGEHRFTCDGREAFVATRFMMRKQAAAATARKHNTEYVWRDGHASL